MKSFIYKWLLSKNPLTLLVELFRLIVKTFLKMNWFTPKTYLFFTTLAICTPSLLNILQEYIPVARWLPSKIAL
jgi:hypothetical protein